MFSKNKKGKNASAYIIQPFDYSCANLESEEAIQSVRRQLERDKYVLEQQKGEFAGEKELGRLQEQMEKLETERKEAIAVNKNVGSILLYSM